MIIWAFGVLKHGLAICSGELYIFWKTTLAYYQVLEEMDHLPMTNWISRILHHELDLTKSLSHIGPGTIHYKIQVVYLGLNNSRTRKHKKTAWAWVGNSNLHDTHHCGTSVCTFAYMENLIRRRKYPKFGIQISWLSIWIQVKKWW